jgi:hypothetical protein
MVKKATPERIKSLNVRTTAHAATARKLEPPLVFVTTITTMITIRIRTRIISII